MRPILGYSGRDCVLINFFQLYALGLSFFKLIYSGWINMTLPPLNLHIGRRTNPILILNTILKQPI